MNEQDYTLIQQYFNGLLSPEEANAVEARAATESVFGAAFALQAEMEAFPKKEAQRAQLQSSLQQLGNEYFKSDSAQAPELKVLRNNTRRWLALAASLALIACAIWFLNPRPASTYAQYATHAPLSLTVMGNTLEAKTEAEKAFAAKNYAQAIQALDVVLSAEPANITARLYKGICLIELQRCAEARAIFEPIALGNSALIEEADWYIALSYLQEKNMPACLDALKKIKPEAAHYKEAQAILNNN